MRKTTIALLLFSLAFIFVAVSCSKDDDSVDYTADADCSAVVASTNTYTNVISGILDVSCASAGCHDAITAAEGVDLSTYAKTKTAFENKEVLCSIHHGSGCEPMPQGGSQLSAGVINLIDCWVKNGYAQ